MSIERQIADALQDFEALMREGRSVASSLRLASNENQVDQSVLQSRAERAFGALSTYENACARKIALDDAQADRDRLVEQFVDGLFAKTPNPLFSFIPIGRFIRDNIPDEGHHDRAYAVARLREQSVRAKKIQNA